ncbi:hypothetical protein GO495_19970 [Chitinophaga oryziterrae]|uniref:Uncharacterized protein n=1 Tax=Chitinophaga oryziterrae TaxID=1031224 RepID=A0A6N8JCF8_9BACT|nr:ankyrin repeat domain-containing protein [Chitinophaga oryziterrae]MVT42883.1 hypothetical protein [Chitinophaga oryziterrae]
MKNIADFHRSIAAIDSGRTAELADLISKHPDLVKDRLHTEGQGYFKDPYLLWFVADNPIRIDKLPPNIIEITRLLADAVKYEAPDTYQDQIDHTLGLVVSGRIPRECGVQIAMIDLLIDAGALPCGAMVALTNGNVEAALHLVDRGDKLTLAVAVCLERIDDINHLAAQASNDEKLTALTAAAFYGKANMVKRLLEMDIDPNGFPEAICGFHSHATPLHQAVSSGSLNCVKLLVEAGARLNVQDKIYKGTPLGWAAHMQSDSFSEEAGEQKFARIESFLRTSEQTL